MYEKLNFKDRIVEKPNTYTVQTNDDGTVTLIPAFGNILQEGTAINHGSMDHIEEGIVELNKNLNNHKTEFTNFKSTVYVKNNFAVLEGTITLPAKDSGQTSGTIEFNYPTSFNMNNCVPIAVLGGRVGSLNVYATTIPREAAYAQSLGVGNLCCKLQDSKVTVSIYKYQDSQASHSSKIKIVLLKYKD